MATAIGFKKVQQLPASPLMSTFYLVNSEDLYIGSKKLNNGDDLADALRRIEDLEDSVSSGGGSGSGVIQRTAKSITLEDAGNNFQANNVEDALAELVEKIGASGGAFSDFILVRLRPEDFSGTSNEGGRSWHTATVPIAKYTSNIIHAIPCGNTLGEMATEEQERRVFALKGYVSSDGKSMMFYSRAVPDDDMMMAIAGVEL